MIIFLIDYKINIIKWLDSVDVCKLVLGKNKIVNENYE